MRIEPFELLGEFWLPEEPTVKVHGYVRVGNGGRVTLDLLGRLITSERQNSFQEKYERVVGNVMGHKSVTLENCIFENGQSDWFGALARSTYHAHVLFLGVIFESKEEPLFHSLSCRIEGLDEWIAISGIKTHFDPQAELLTISYSRPSKVILWESDGLSVAIQFGAKLPSIPVVTNATISQQSHLVVSSDRKRPLPDFLPVVGKIRNLLCIAVDENVTPYDLEATFSIGEPQAGKEVELHKSRVIFQSIRFQETAPKIEGHRILFGYDLIALSSQATMQAWMDLVETIGPSMNLFLSARAGEFSYLNFRFLSMAQAVETFHNRTCPEQGERVTLKERLTQLFSVFAKHFGDDATREALVDKIVFTRDYFTHYNPNKEDKAAEGEDLWTIYCKLEVLLQLHLLRKLGFSDLFVDALVAENSDIQEKLHRKIAGFQTDQHFA